jgi:protein-S-isoprenylcysteine O-methyltransferase Ste14
MPQGDNACFIYRYVILYNFLNNSFLINKENAVYSLIAFASYIAIQSLGQGIIGLRTGVRSIPHKNTLRFCLLLLTAELIGMPLALITARRESFHLVQMVVGSGVILAGLTLIMWAQWILGRNWVGGVALHEKHELVTSGPYQYVRHPLYLGMIISGLGIGVFSWNAFYLLTALCYCGAYTTRCGAESRALSKRFPQEYTQYASTTGALLPKFRNGG